jgi:hypothetical protein
LRSLLGIFFLRSVGSCSVLLLFLIFSSLFSNTLQFVLSLSWEAQFHSHTK